MSGIDVIMWCARSAAKKAAEEERELLIRKEEDELRAYAIDEHGEVTST